MDVSSPGNGLNEINDLLRNDDGPCMSDELGLEFLLNKDVSSSYFYNDLVGDDKFLLDVNEQQEEATLLSDVRLGEIAETASENFDSSRTDCHRVDLSENNFIYDVEKLDYESQENLRNEESEGYIPNDFLKLESDSAEIQMESKNSSPTSQFVAEHDANLDRESPDSSTYVQDEKSEKTATLEHDEIIRSESSDGETEECILEKQEIRRETVKNSTSTSKDTQQITSPSGRNDTTALSDGRKVDETESPSASMPTNASLSKKRETHSGSPRKYHDKRFGYNDPSLGHASRKEGGFSSQSSQDRRKGQSNSSGYYRQNPTSRDSWKRPKISSVKHVRASPRYHQPYMGHRITDRPRSASPARQKTGYKRDSRYISRSRSPRRRESRQKLQRKYSPSHRTPSTPPSTKHHSSHRSTYSSPPHRRDFGSGKPGRCLFIAGFCYRTTERDLERKFSKFGRVGEIRVIRDKRSGDSRGFGFVTLERDEDADAAIRALNNTDWNGRAILVEKSNAPS